MRNNSIERVETIVKQVEALDLHSRINFTKGTTT
jgi:hypothetical protein